MNPITAMRNALGKEEGGSGVLLDRSKYMESVNYWKDHGILTVAVASLSLLTDVAWQS